MRKYNVYHKNITNYEYIDNKVIKVLECNNIYEAIENIMYKFDYTKYYVNCDQNTAVFEISKFKLFGMEITNLIVVEQDDL